MSDEDVEEEAEKLSLSLVHERAAAMVYPSKYVQDNQ
jgi:hypothetical protein